MGRVVIFLAILAIAAGSALAQVERLPPVGPAPVPEPPVLPADGGVGPSIGDELLRADAPNITERSLAGVPVVGDEFEQDWDWQILPRSLLWHSYLAGVKEPRFASVWSDEKSYGKIWEVTLGGRAGIIRYGNRSDTHPEGWQFDIEGAAIPRLDPIAESTPVIAIDYRFGLPLTYGWGPFHAKFAYEHLSSHLGDEFMLMHPGLVRINYSRDALTAAVDYFPNEDLRLYAEASFGVSAVGGAEPWEFQLGADYSPVPNPGRWSSPFAAVNGHLREDVNFGGEFVAQLGWQWRHGAERRLFRLGAQVETGSSTQYEFYNQSEQQVGFGMWYDF